MRCPEQEVFLFAWEFISEGSVVWARPGVAGGHQGLLTLTPQTPALEAAAEGTGSSKVSIAVTCPGGCEGIPWLSAGQGRFRLSRCGFGHVVCELLLYRPGRWSKEWVCPYLCERLHWGYLDPETLQGEHLILTAGSPGAKRPGGLGRVSRWSLVGPPGTADCLLP